jgi:hypothetical protein
MKKTILSASFVLALFTSFAFSAENPVDGKILAAFHKEFKTANEINWRKVNGYDAVSFHIQNKYLTAYYEETGELKAVTRNLLSEQLPINLQNALKDGFSHFWITELFEMASHGETAYYISLENGDQKVTLKSSNSIDWSVVSKEDNI